MKTKIRDLTPREKECANLAASGMTSQKIAIALNMSSEQVVKNHLRMVYLKLNIDGRNNLRPAMKALEERLANVER